MQFPHCDEFSKTNNVCRKPGKSLQNCNEVNACVNVTWQPGLRQSVMESKDIIARDDEEKALGRHHSLKPNLLSIQSSEDL